MARAYNDRRSNRARFVPFPNRTSSLYASTDPLVTGTGGARQKTMLGWDDDMWRKAASWAKTNHVLNAIEVTVASSIATKLGGFSSPITDRDRRRGRKIQARIRERGYEPAPPTRLFRDDAYR